MSDDLFTYGLAEPFPGKMGKTIDDSVEAWPMPVQAAEDAPNVLFYVLDDVGFGQLEPFAVFPTPESSNTRTGMTLASGAAPAMPTRFAVTAAAMPARWLPCP